MRRSGTVFPYSLWRWTAADENLFSLDKYALEVFKRLASEASK